MGVILRAIWFLTIGWPLAILWLGISVALIVSIIGAPIGIYMASKTWAIATFKRKPQVVYVEAKQQRAE